MGVGEPIQGADVPIHAKNGVDRAGYSQRFRLPLGSNACLAAFVDSLFGPLRNSIV
jgi:hypothetical protein